MLVAGCTVGHHLNPVQPPPLPVPIWMRREIKEASFRPVPTGFVTTNSPVPPVQPRWHTNVITWNYYENLNSDVMFNLWGSSDVRKANSTLIASNLTGTTRSYTCPRTNDTFFYNLSVFYTTNKSAFTP